MSDEMSTAVSVGLQIHDRRSSIADEIWGSCIDNEYTLERIEILSSFFIHFEEQHRFEKALEQQIIPALRLLKQNPERRRLDLRAGYEREVIKTSDTPNEVIFDLLARCVFLTACSSPSALGGGSIFRLRWKDSESLERYLARVYPTSKTPNQDLATFRLGKLNASYLQLFANIQIKWTNNLTDHLTLLKGDTWKSLYVFRHPGFIKVCLDTLSADNENLSHTTLEALKLYEALPHDTISTRLMKQWMFAPPAFERNPLDP
ncbi:hypothetical protein F4859DRAFT_528243 [Xylaria cf. heliscus]|nr:hypothetical protein F4859DRAFT_528243 [Xylaria cf. heliscus]